ncbi:DsbA family protein [Tropicimonas sp.]|uniref:DsbA family protein n=1 Tax=Tropicimonas sp. TaxID=2067044 RepID=UPI003A88ACF4
MTDTPRIADPMEWGKGARVFEVFLEPTCPFSVRALGKIDRLVELAGPENITVRLRLLSQPWHMYSGVIVRCVLAASMLEGGRKNARSVLDEVGAHREEFEFEAHCRGPNMDVTPRQIIARIEEYCGIPLAAAFEFPELEAAVKWQAKYARQNGIHVSPTFMIDGLIQPDIASGDAVEDWVAKLVR